MEPSAPVPATRADPSASQHRPARSRRLSRLVAGIVLFSLIVILILPYLLPLPGAPGLPAEAVAPAGGRFVTAAGTATFVREAGPRDGPPVLLIHGFGGSTYSWRDTLPSLGAAGYRAVALDLRGFGLSDKRFEVDYSHPSQAVFVTALMDEMELDEAYFVGHSMGGNVVAHIAQQMPERVAGLVMVDAAIAWQNENDANDVASWLLRVPPLRRWLRIGLRLALTEARYRSILESAVADPTFVTPDVAAGYYRPQRVDGWDLALLGIVRDRGRSGLSAPLQQVSAPTLIIWGKQDSWVPLAAGRRLDASLPNSEMVVMDDTGHLPMEERPEEFNRILLDWLQAQ